MDELRTVQFLCDQMESKKLTQLEATLRVMSAYE